MQQIKNPIQTLTFPIRIISQCDYCGTFQDVHVYTHPMGYKIMMCNNCRVHN